MRAKKDGRSSRGALGTFHRYGQLAPRAAKLSSSEAANPHSQCECIASFSGLCSSAREKIRKKFSPSRGHRARAQRSREEVRAWMPHGLPRGNAFRRAFSLRSATRNSTDDQSVPHPEGGHPHPRARSRRARRCVTIAVTRMLEVIGKTVLLAECSASVHGCARLRPKPRAVLQGPPEDEGPMVGVEPTTSALRKPRSAIELHRQPNAPHVPGRQD